jgi:hypothetical protein
MQDDVDEYDDMMDSKNDYLVIVEYHVFVVPLIANNQSVLDLFYKKIQQLYD